MMRSIETHQSFGLDPLGDDLGGVKHILPGSLREALLVGVGTAAGVDVTRHACELTLGAHYVGRDVAQVRGCKRSNKLTLKVDKQLLKSECFVSVGKAFLT